jgi:hypothetical protein
VVEHSIGNGEVDSSILSGSTSFPFENQCLDKRALPVPPRSGRERKSNLPQTVGENVGTPFPHCSPTLCKDWPPDPKMRSPRNGGNRARANRKIEALSTFEDTLPALQAQQLRRRFAIALPFAELVASLHFARPER